MSYFSDLKAGRLSIPGFLKKSVGWLARKADFTDSDVDRLVQKGDILTDNMEEQVGALFGAFMAQTFPAVPAPLRDVLAVRGVHAAFNAIDAGLAGFGEELKKITPDDPPA